MKKNVLFLTVLAFSCLQLTSCKKDEYQPKGKYGDTEITSSTTVTVSNFQEAYNDGESFGFTSTLSAPDISSSIVTDGAVLGFFAQNGMWTAMPYSYSDANKDFNIVFSYGVGQIKIVITGYNFSSTTSASELNGTQFRFVYLSPAQIASNPNVDFTNYESVKKLSEL